jgi:hypothetical protein
MERGAASLHREDGPAEEHANGAKFWYRDGVLKGEFRPTPPAL